MRGALTMMALSLGRPVAACEAPGPQIAAVEPAQAPRGATVRVHGTGFCGDGRGSATGDCVPLPPGSVVFGLELPAARAAVQAWRDDAIAVTVPTGAAIGSTVVVVTVDGRSSGGGDFEVTP